MKTLMIDSLVGNEYAACLCQGLHDAGVDVELVATEDREIADHYTFPVLKIAPSKEEDKNKALKLIKYFQYLISIVWLAKRKRANAVHFQFFRRERMESLLFPIMRLFGIYLVHTAHNVLPHEHSKIDYYLKYLVYRSSNAIIVHSQFIKDKLLSMFKVDPDKIAVIPHGNFDVYLPKEKITQAEAREKLSIDLATPILLFFGYIREYKGVGHLLETFDQAADTVPDLKLIVAGNPHTDELGERYHKQIAGMRHKDRVIYVPMFIPTEDVALYFNAADAVVLPYKHIDHSGIVHMAYSFGKPVIATDVGDFSEMIENGHSGLVVPPGDVAALSAAIQTAYKNIDHLRSMGEYATKLNKTKYSWHDISMKTGTVYARGTYYEKVEESNLNVA